MSTFVTELLQSIFTPGPTPTLLVATNVTFACLQVVLFLLLIATYSIHFAILSCLSAGLWWAINWFANEIKTSQLLEEEKKQQQQMEADRVEDDTETEAETIRDSEGLGSTNKHVELLEPKGNLRDRGISGGSKSEISTEDEWERVSENEKDK